MFTRIRKERGDQGFTLIELLVVIIIIGILAAIAIPVFLNQRKKGWDAAVQADLRNAVTAEETYLTANNAYTKVIADLTGVGFKYSDAKNYYGATLAKITADADAGNSYCLSAQSASGDFWSFGSASGLKNNGAVEMAVNNKGVCAAA
jgi:type IV pilus assembly protein PilA